MVILITIVLSLLGGLLYRIGGASHSDFPYLPKWLVNTRTRDLGVPAVMLLEMIVLKLWHWSLIPCFFLLWPALTTYNKWAGRWVWTVDKGDYTDVFWPSWAVTGLFYGLSMVPYAFFTGHWWMMGIRAVILAVLTCLWSEWQNDVRWEEGGRGALIIATLPLFLIGG